MIPKIPVDISLPDPILGTSSCIALVLSCLFIYLALSRIKRLKLWQSGFYAALSFIFFSSAAIILLTALNIHNYQRLSDERDVAEIHFHKLSQQLYSAELFFADERESQKFELRGDEWQLDARVIKWKAPLTLVGFNSLFRMDRLQGRYRDIEQARHAPRTVFALNEDRNLDLWSVIQQYRKWLPWIDSFYGNASYLPMADDSIFEIKMSQSGLIAKPVNEAAREAVGEWN
jgi:hypothetical protein